MGVKAVKIDPNRKPEVGESRWTLKSCHAKNAQGLIVSAFKHAPVGEALLLTLPERAGGTWLTPFQDQGDLELKITDASGHKLPSITLALTSSGLRRTGLDRECLETFSPPFVEGMRQIYRQRRLGDGVLDPITNETVVSRTVIPDGVLWSGNACDRYATPGERVSERTQITVHAILLLYHKDRVQLERIVAKAEAALARANVEIVRRIDLSLREDPEGRFREHFGFVDGISQPIPYGRTIEPNRLDPWHAVPAGDILIGHGDTIGDPTPSPFVSKGKPGAEVLPQGTAPYGFKDLGLDGSYLVVRELRQDVEAFRRSVKAAAQALSRTWDETAARVVGRTLDGDPLIPDGVRLPRDGKPVNDFGFLQDDHDGLGCPMGAHIRRANPRDGLAPFSSDEKTFLKASNNHRMLRRGRKFGPSFDENPQAERGLLFMAVNTDIARQFEFVQQTWILNQSFAALYDETDPLVGPKGSFTVPVREEPIRPRLDVETFVRLVGGDYFFLPSLAAMKYLSQLV